MEIKNLENYSGMFFLVSDESLGDSGDEFVKFFTTYEEALHEADLQWYRLTSFEKKDRRVLMAVSNTASYPDCDKLTSSDEDFVERPQEDIKECVSRYKMDSEQTKLYRKADKEYQERLLEEKKELHKKQMKIRDEAMAKLQNSTDIEKCVAWMKDGYPQPSGNDILRIKKELGLSWSKFKSFIENV